MIMKLMSKKQYELERMEYESWVALIKFITFGKLDLSDAVDEIFKDVVIVDI